MVLSLIIKIIIKSKTKFVSENMTNLNFLIFLYKMIITLLILIVDINNYLITLLLCVFFVNSLLEFICDNHKNTLKLTRKKLIRHLEAAVRGFLQNRYSKIFRKFNRKTPVLKSYFDFILVQRFDTRLTVNTPSPQGLVNTLSPLPPSLQGLFLIE